MLTPQPVDNGQATAVATALFNQFAEAIDTKDWEGYAELFTEDGRMVLPWREPVARSEMVELNAVNFAIFSITQHVISNQTASVNSDRISAWAYLIATHVYEPSQNRENNWVVGARYDAQIELAGEKFLFSELTLTALWQMGDLPFR